MRQIFLSLLLVGLFYSSIAQNWQPLFNGKDLTGWESRGGKAPYVVEDGVIVGTAVLNTPN
ncbi:MAG TPA: DUF1080 domain-containing protein, partial [Cytophagales bacterium]|nr:DUF1080 domain-containing protein [Cytophagales bacterium]